MPFAPIVHKLIRRSHGLSLFTPFQMFSSSPWHRLPHPLFFEFIWLTETSFIVWVHVSSLCCLPLLHLAPSQTPLCPPGMCFHYCSALPTCSFFIPWLHCELLKVKGSAIYSFLYPPRSVVGLQELNVEWTN